VFTESGEVNRLKQENEDRNKQLQTLVNSLVSENMELKTKMSQVETEITEIKKALEKLSS